MFLRGEGAFPKRRGKKAAAKEEGAEPKAARPAKRGILPVKAETAGAPKRRGRPPKAEAEETPKRRGRPPKAEAGEGPKRRTLKLEKVEKPGKSAVRKPRKAKSDQSE